MLQLITHPIARIPPITETTITTVWSLFCIGSTASVLVTFDVEFVMDSGVVSSPVISSSVLDSGFAVEAETSFPVEDSLLVDWANPVPVKQMKIKTICKM